MKRREGSAEARQPVSSDLVAKLLLGALRAPETRHWT
jgi:hypothetical protein